MSDSASINFNGKEIKLPVITGSENEKAIDISKLRAETGLVTIDKGFKNTGSTTSNITYLDGEKGILRHRGYSIEDLASKSTFILRPLPSRTSIVSSTKLSVISNLYRSFHGALNPKPGVMTFFLSSPVEPNL